jgi:hypothetical protein
MQQAPFHLAVSRAIVGGPRLVDARNNDTKWVS